MNTQTNNSIEETVEEFNSEDSNENVLGRYLKHFTEVFMWDDKEKVRLKNKEADKEINDWLRTILTQIRKEAVEEERERCANIVAKSRTVDEHLGVGKNEETARNQAVADILTNPHQYQ